MRLTGARVAGAGFEYFFREDGKEGFCGEGPGLVGRGAR
jgi:hypothetical protein